MDRPCWGLLTVVGNCTLSYRWHNGKKTPTRLIHSILYIFLHIYKNFIQFVIQLHLMTTAISLCNFRPWIKILYFFCVTVSSCLYYMIYLWPDDGLVGAETCSHSDKKIRTTYSSCVLTVNCNPNEYSVRHILSSFDLYV